MDKNTALDYIEKVVGYNLENNTKPSEPHQEQLPELTKAQNMIAKDKFPSKNLHMATYIRNYQDALRFDYQNGVYSDNEDKKDEMKLEQMGEEIIDSNMVNF